MARGRELRARVSRNVRNTVRRPPASREALSQRQLGRTSAHAKGDQIPNGLTGMTTTDKPAQTTDLPSMSPTEPGAQTMTLSVGPQHSGSGHMRLIVELDGDIIINAMPDPGYVHRGIEKIIELRNIIRSIPVIERPSIIDASNLNHAWVRAIEELQGVEPPARGQYLRCLLNEMNRIMSHLYWLSIYGVFLGHTTMFMWPLGDRDLRKDEPYAAYGELDFKVRTRPDGDSYSRAMVHMDEMRESSQLIRQILEKLPTGPVRRKAPIVVPRGEAYGRVESARGECSFYMIGEGGDKPYRARFITGSYRNMAAISEVLKGVRLADMPTSWWSIDYWPVEADR